MISQLRIVMARFMPFGERFEHLFQVMLGQRSFRRREQFLDVPAERTGQSLLANRKSQIGSALAARKNSPLAFIDRLSCNGRRPDLFFRKNGSRSWDGSRIVFTQRLGRCSHRQVPQSVFSIR